MKVVAPKPMDQQRHFVEIKARLERQLAKGLAPTLVLLLAGCASSPVPQQIRKPLQEPLSVARVQLAPARFLGREVRWGGTILSVRNRRKTTEIEILSRPLDSQGEPQEDVAGKGRFIAQLKGFADRADYPEKRLLTVTGRLMQTETRPIGEYPYDYPVVAVESQYLWPEEPSPGPGYYYPDPWLYPRYYPWYPWVPWYYPWY